MKPVLVFDLGKVLVDFDYSIAAGKIVTRCKAGASADKFFSSHAALLASYETGLFTTQQFFEEVCAASGYAGTAAEFGDSFADIFTPIQAMVDLHAELRRRKIATYIFSNTNELAVDHIRSRYPFFSEFDGYVLSYEHGAMKPGARLYEIVERMSGRKGRELIYIDDRVENVDAGAARGWKSILHEDPVKTREALARLGFDG